MLKREVTIIFMTMAITISLEVIIGGIILSFSLFVYWLFYVPLNIVKNSEDVLFNKLKGKYSNKDLKREVVNRAKRLRKVGKEVLPPFPNGWFALTESNTVKTGEAISVSCLGENFVVFRTKTNHVYVLDAYCSHMGANLGMGGSVRGECIECPFHHWRFNGADGECTSVPYSKTDTVPKNSKIRKWTSTEINGLIFVWYDVENRDPWILPNIKEIETGEFVYCGRNEFHVDCHIREISENGADVAHFSAVHSDSILAGGNPKSKWYANFGTHLWEEPTWEANTEPGNKHIAKVSFVHWLKVFGKYKTFWLNVTAEQIGPGYVVLRLKTFFTKFVIVISTTPVEPLVQQVVHRFYGPRISIPFLKYFIFGETVMFERDMAMWTHKKFRDSSSCLVKEDRNIKLFRNWFNQFFSQNSKSFSDAKYSLDW